LKMLGASNPGIRAAAVRLLPAGLVQQNVSLGVNDEHPRVRLESVRALARVPWPKSPGSALRALDIPIDQWLDYALWLAMRDLEPEWTPALKRGEMPFSNIKHLIFSLKSVDAGGAAPTIVGLLKSGKVKKEDETELLVLLAEAGGPNELAVVLDHALADE